MPGLKSTLANQINNRNHMVEAFRIPSYVRSFEVQSTVSIHSLIKSTSTLLDESKIEIFTRGLGIAEKTYKTRRDC